MMNKNFDAALALSFIAALLAAGSLTAVAANSSAIVPAREVTSATSPIPKPTPAPTSIPNPPVVAGINSSPTPAPIPFWKSKPEIYAKMKDRRYIAVSAKAENEGDDKKLTVVAAGIIHAPESFTHKVVMKISDYPKYVPYIEEASYDETTQDIFVHGAVLGYHMKMTLHTHLDVTADGHRLEWTSVGGSFVGMSGSINERAIDIDHTEISMDGLYRGKSLGIPGFLLDWGLEFAAHRAAGSMRSHIESEWEDSKKH